METPAALDEGDPRRLGGDQPVAESNFLTERDALRLLDEQRVGSAVDRESVDLFAQDDSAGAVRMLEDDEADAAPRQLVSGSRDRRCRRPPPRRRRSCGLADEVFEQRDECGRRVQRRGPPQAGRELARHVRACHVDVELDFGRVAHASDRDDEKFPRARARWSSISLAEVGADHGSVGESALW
jgi:hypothetical protein